ncbi:MAG: hypothetical protein WCO56_09135 [Verrucomicrobiota bacterium]
MGTQLLLQKIVIERKRRLDGFQAANVFRVYTCFAVKFPTPVPSLDSNLSFLAVIFLPIYFSAKFGVFIPQSAIRIFGQRLGTFSSFDPLPIPVHGVSHAKC